MKRFRFSVSQHFALPVLFLSASCLAWGYHHPAAIRLSTDEPITTSSPPPPTNYTSNTSHLIPPSVAKVVEVTSKVTFPPMTGALTFTSTSLKPKVQSSTVKGVNEESFNISSSTTTTATSRLPPSASTSSKISLSSSTLSSVVAVNTTSGGVSFLPSHRVPLILPGSNTSSKYCVRNESEVSFWDFGRCFNKCTNGADCNTNQNETCLCDGPCGMSCVTSDLISIHCEAPGSVENGKALLVGDGSVTECPNTNLQVTLSPIQNILVIFECDEGFTLIDGPQEKICRNGLWFPTLGEPKCVFSNTPGFRWMQSNRVKRRAIKSGAGSMARNRVTGGRRGGGSGGGRRGKKKGENQEENEDEDLGGLDEAIECEVLDEEYDPYILTEVLVKGNDPNMTGSSEGAVVRVSCTHGHGVNLQNDTIRCDEKGRWKPKLPMCSALPCKVPYIAHGTFYLGGKALFFMEMKNHDTGVELRCSKGYRLSGPSKFHCWYGEWDLTDAPECLQESCNLPPLDRGSYASRFRAGMVVGHGTEVDYHCDGEFQKMAPGGPAKCHLGEWRPNKPTCFHPSYINGMKNFTHDKDNKLITSIKRACGVPKKEKGAIFYVEGKPIDYDTDYIFPDSTEVMYRCAAAKPKPKNRWKMMCEDGQWVGGLANLTCEMNSTWAANLTSIKDTIRMINSSCEYKKKETHVVTFFEDKMLSMDTAEFPPGSYLINRCIDIGKFKLRGAVRRKCVSGQWLGITPKCEGLSQYYDYVVDKPPTILFRYLNGSIVQTNIGQLMVYPGTTLHMECLYIRRFGKPAWNVSNTQKTYAEGWTDGIENRDPTLEYRLTIEDASEEDTGNFSCYTPSRHGHQVDIIVKKVDCPPLPERSDLARNTDSTMLGTRVNFTCKESNTLIGSEEIICQATGSWSGSLPKCENVECPNISMLPALAPLDYSSMTRNSTLKRNETAPPKITIASREVGGKATFSCAQGYMVEGVSEAVCQATGTWSAPVPVCKEVECTAPPSPSNGFVTGNAPYKAGDLAQFECRPGFMMEGQPIIACQDNGKWSRSSSSTKCVKACTYPGTTIGGTISAVKFYYPVGETVIFDCTEGYDLQGSRMLHCLDNAKWSTSIPSCILRDGNAGMGLGRKK